MGGCECWRCQQERLDARWEDREDTPAAFVGVFLITLAFLIWFLAVVQL